MNKKIKNFDKLTPYSPTEEILNGDLIGKAILECLQNNDPKGVMEVIGIYLETLERAQVIQKASMPKSTFYYSLKSKNPTIKTLAKLVHATTLDSRKQ